MSGLAPATMPPPERLAALVEGVVLKETRLDRRRRYAAGASLEGDLGLDAIDRLTISMNLEDATDCALTDAEINGWLTPGDIVRTMERLRGE